MLLIEYLIVSKYFQESFVSIVQKLRAGRETAIHPLSKKGGLTIIGHSTSMVLDTEIWFWESIMVTVSHLVHCDTILQNPTSDKMQQRFYYKMRRRFITNASALLQNATFITKCVSATLISITLERNQICVKNKVGCTIKKIQESLSSTKQIDSGLFSLKPWL